MKNTGNAMTGALVVLSVLGVIAALLWALSLQERIRVADSEEKEVAQLRARVAELEQQGAGGGPGREKELVQPVAVEDGTGYVSLFNGKDLMGWVGDTQGYVVEDGNLVCKPGENLFTEKEFANFSFKFEFKLTPGANNGIGIRAPLTGNAAYEGMEIQILDHGDPQYKDIYPWQAHGSIYGIVPAMRDKLRPVGEWNTEEIIADGRDVKVILNGTTIVDANLDHVTANGTMDGRLHAGLKNEKGHIGFLGHGSVVEFRNLRVKELGK